MGSGFTGFHSQIFFITMYLTYSFIDWIYTNLFLMRKDFIIKRKRKKKKKKQTENRKKKKRDKNTASESKSKWE